MKCDTSCLLSRDSSEKIGIIALIGSVSAHPELHKGLGTMPHPYDVKLKPNAQPFSVDTPRRISLPLLSKAKDEISRLEASGVIRKVDEPTEWLCSSCTSSQTLRFSSHMCQLHMSE